MRILLTGASGFVGSHILDRLRAKGLPARLLLRATSRRQFVGDQTGLVETAEGSLDDPASLQTAVQGCSHVIHCAGATRALNAEGFHQANATGTRNLVEAINTQGDAIERLVHISSLAAGHPAARGQPAREDDPPAPVSAYGRSKLAAEQAVREHCRVSSVILRPPAVYGPRDPEFLRMFKAARLHLRLVLLGGPSELSLVHVSDLAEAVLLALTQPASSGRTYYVAHPEPVSPEALAVEIAAQMGTWTLPMPLPAVALWPVCLLQTVVSRLSHRPNVLGLHKYPELVAPGWVCDASRIGRELGFTCRVGLAEGIRETWAWYRKEGWL